MKDQVQGNAKRQKRAFMMLAICIAAILLATLVGSLIQTNGWTVEVSDLRNVSNSGTYTLTPVDDPDVTKRVEQTFTLQGKIDSGILFMPKHASVDNKLPAIIFRHGAYNNREMQLSFAIEMVRRGYVVLTIDNANHGHNTDSTSGQHVGIIDAAIYLVNTGKVDATRIGISGHSMGGAATNATLQYDSVLPGTQTVANFKAKRHLGLFSAGVTQAAGAPTPFTIDFATSGTEFNILSESAVAAIAAGEIVVSGTKVTFNDLGSNVLGSAIVKGNADEFFYGGSILKEKQYILQNNNVVTELNYKDYFVKKGDQYVPATKFVKNGKYYAYTNIGGTAQYMQSSQCYFYTRGVNPTATDDWVTQNRAIYANGALLKAPEGNKRVSVLTKGQALASDTVSLRAVYEEQETHPMNHFSIPTTANVIDFFYNVYGVVEGAKFINPMNQTWWIKEGFACLGIIGLFAMLIPILDLLLMTPLFASLKGEPAEAPILLTRPRKHVSYWLGGILCTIFGAISFANLTANGKWHSALGLDKLLDNASEGFIYANIGKMATWGILCAIFILVVTGLIWLVNHLINLYKYGDDCALYDEKPFAGFQIRSWGNILKTIGMAAILVGIFFGAVFLIWYTTHVQMQIWVFGPRVFTMTKLASMVRYIPFFFIFYLVMAVGAQGYRVKDLPEWATIAINVFFNVAGFMIMVWYANSYFIANGAMSHANNSMHFIHAYPMIPSIAIATVMARRIYVRTGNAWLAGLVNATLMTVIACANTSFAANSVAWFYGR
jgi:pimeloyl-ACP methyl ester carboxylesterase